MRRRQAASCKRQAANSGLHIREARGKRHAASSTHAASGMQPAAHLVLSFLLIGPAASFLVAVMVHSLPTGRFQIFSQDNVRTAVLAGGHCTGLWCLPVAAVCCRSPCCAYLGYFCLLHKSLSLSSSATFRIFHCIPVVRIPAVCVLRFPRCVAFCTLHSAHSYACVLRPLALSCAYHSCTFLRSPALF